MKPCLFKKKERRRKQKEKEKKKSQKLELKEPNQRGQIARLCLCGGVQVQGQAVALPVTALGVSGPSELPSTPAPRNWSLGR